MSDWEPGRWWRVTYTRPDGAIALWCESSDEDEVRNHLELIPLTFENVKLEREWVCKQHEWRETE